VIMTSHRAGGTGPADVRVQAGPHSRFTRDSPHQPDAGCRPQLIQLGHHHRRRFLIPGSDVQDYQARLGHMHTIDTVHALHDAIDAGPVHRRHAHHSYE